MFFSHEAVHCAVRASFTNPVNSKYEEAVAMQFMVWFGKRIGYIPNTNIFSTEFYYISLNYFYFFIPTKRERGDGLLTAALNIIALPYGDVPYVYPPDENVDNFLRENFSFALMGSDGSLGVLQTLPYIYGNDYFMVMTMVR